MDNYIPTHSFLKTLENIIKNCMAIATFFPCSEMGMDFAAWTVPFHNTSLFPRIAPQYIEEDPHDPEEYLHYKILKTQYTLNIPETFAWVRRGSSFSIFRSFCFLSPILKLPCIPLQVVDLIPIRKMDAARLINFLNITVTQELSNIYPHPEVTDMYETLLKFWRMFRCK